MKAWVERHENCKAQHNFEVFFPSFLLALGFFEIFQEKKKK